MDTFAAVVIVRSYAPHVRATVRNGTPFERSGAPSLGVGRLPVLRRDFPGRTPIKVAAATSPAQDPLPTAPPVDLRAMRPASRRKTLVSRERVRVVLEDAGVGLRLVFMFPLVILVLGLPIVLLLSWRVDWPHGDAPAKPPCESRSGLLPWGDSR